MLPTVILFGNGGGGSGGIKIITSRDTSRAKMCKKQQILCKVQNCTHSRVKVGLNSVGGAVVLVIALNNRFSALGQ